MTRSGMFHSGMTKYAERKTDGSDYKGMEAESAHVTVRALRLININSFIFTA